MSQIYLQTQQWQPTFTDNLGVWDGQVEWKLKVMYRQFNSSLYPIPPGNIQLSVFFTEISSILAEVWFKFMKIILSDWQSGGASGKEPAADLRDTVLEDALEKEMATHSSILAWRILRTEESGRLRSLESKRVGHDWSDLAHTRSEAR